MALTNPRTGGRPSPGLAGDHPRNWRATLPKPGGRPPRRALFLVVPPAVSGLRPADKGWRVTTPPKTKQKRGRPSQEPAGDQPKNQGLAGDQPKTWRAPPWRVAGGHDKDLQAAALSISGRSSHELAGDQPASWWATAPRTGGCPPRGPAGDTPNNSPATCPPTPRATNPCSWRLVCTRLGQINIGLQRLRQGPRWR